MSGNKIIPIISHRCPKCGADNTPRCKAQSLAMVCTSCGTYFTFGNWSNEEVKFLDKLEPAIPIGSKGRFRNSLFEVVGFVVKQDLRYRVSWREYVLFNPMFGLAYLSEYNGHWNFNEPISGDPKEGKVGNSFHVHGKEYQLFQKYQAEILFAQGEFSFDIFQVTDNANNFEYIAPPYLLGWEVSDTSSLWYKGEYISKSDVADAFQILEYKLPEQTGVGSTQPVLDVQFKHSSLVIITVVLAAIIIGLQVLFSFTAAEKLVFNQTFYKGDIPKEGDKLFVTPSFELEGGQKSVTVKIKAPVDNDWFYASLILVNEVTGDEYNFSNEVGYYHGYSDGESWSEGSTIGEAFLSQIPGGTYHLVIFPEFNQSDTFELWVVRDVSAPSNMFLTLLGLILFPLVFFIYKQNREKVRWSESDYSPYDKD